MLSQLNTSHQAVLDLEFHVGKGSQPYSALYPDRSCSIATDTTLCATFDHSAPQHEDGYHKIEPANDANRDEHCIDLKPIDKGKDAYLVLAAAFILQALVPGFPFAYGVFQEYYSTSSEFAHGNETDIAAIGTSATGIFFLAAPFMYALSKQRPTWRKPLAIAGSVIMTGALIGASFANTVHQLLATQGILYAVGGVLLFYPVLVYIDEWWHARKGFAYGVVWSGACVSGVVIPFLMGWMLDTYDFRTALRTWAVIMSILTVPALVWLKPRLPQARAREDRFKVELGFLSNKSFWILQVGNICFGLGYSIPVNYLPRYAHAIGLSALIGTLSISVMNVGNAAGSIIVGMLVDRFHVTTAINVCVVGTVITVILPWTLAVSAPVLLMFAILYGAFGGGFSSTWAGCADPVRKQHPGTDTGLIVSMFHAGKGIGYLISGPLSGALVSSDVWTEHSAAYAFGTGYGNLIIFTAVTASLGCLGWVGKRCGYV